MGVSPEPQIAPAVEVVLASVSRTCDAFADMAHDAKSPEDLQDVLVALRLFCDVQIALLSA